MIEMDVLKGDLNVVVDEVFSAVDSVVFIDGFIDCVLVDGAVVDDEVVVETVDVVVDTEVDNLVGVDTATILIFVDGSDN